MNKSNQKKLLIFGAGKIGRSFIAQLFYNAGFKIIFVDVNGKLVDLLNKKQAYNIIIKGEEEKHTLRIKNIEAIHVSDKKKIHSEVIRCDVCAVSTGQDSFPEVADLLASGLVKRRKQYPDYPLDIILAENLRDASKWMSESLKQRLPEDFPLESYTGLIETSIGKMVPIMTGEDLKKDPLQVFAEPYNTLILDAKGFKNPVPEVEGLSPESNMKAWVDRKLFIHNLGHSCLAYLGYIKNPGWKYTWEALEDRELKTEVYRCMQEAANVLRAMHPGEFTKSQLSKHIQDLLRRFANRALGDTIFRVGCDLERKLGPNDRLVPVVKFANSKGLPFQYIMKALISGVYFDAKDENGKSFPSDLNFLQKFNRNVSRILVEHCNFKADEDNRVHILSLNLDHQIKQKLNS